MSVLTKNWATLLGLAVATAGVTIGGAAQALPQFTFSPGAVGLNGASFTADNIQISDFSTITLTNTSATTQSFTNDGTLAVSNFQIGSGSPVSTPGLNSTYGLYLNFASSGTQTTYAPGVTAGTFTTLYFTLNAFSRAAGDTITYASRPGMAGMPSRDFLFGAGLKRPGTLAVDETFSGCAGPARFARLLPGRWR